MSLAILFHFIFNFAFSVGGIGFLWVRCLICSLLKIRLHCFMFCVICFWYLFVGVFGVACCASACNMDTTPTQPHRNSNTHRTKNNTTNVVIQQKSRKLLMMDILMSETCWAHKKWNKIASDIKLVLYSSIILDCLTSRHAPTNARHKRDLTLFTYYKCTFNLGLQCSAVQSSNKQRFCWKIRVRKKLTHLGVNDRDAGSNTLKDTHSKYYYYY